MKLLLILSLILPLEAFSETYKVYLLNKGKEDKSARMVFEPDFLHLKPGDTIDFLLPDSGHNVKSMVIPKGAKEIKGRMNKPISYKFEKEGLYLLKCQPHLGMGMIALFQVGKPVNLEEIKKAKVKGKRSRERFKVQLSKVKN